MKVRQIIWIGLAIGVVGAVGQLLLVRMGPLVSASLRAILTLAIPTFIGVLFGIKSPSKAPSSAALAAVISGLLASSAEFISLFMDPSIVSRTTLSSVESFLLLSGSVICVTVVLSWVFAGLAALVAVVCSPGSDIKT
jgi:hypothetical protein